MIDLDDPKIYPALDPSDMASRLRGMADQCQKGWEMAQKLTLPKEFSQVKHLIVAGMGGSSISGEILLDLLLHEETVPVTLWREYGLPGWVNRDALVVVSSYSGDTEETISAFEEALRRGVRVVALTRGGRIKAIAQSHGVPVLEVDHKGEPRTALGYTLFALLSILQSLSLAGESYNDAQDAIAALRRLSSVYGPDRPFEDNPAKGMSHELWGKLTVIFGADLLRGVARRWKTQINENAKAWAFAEVLPEGHHNTVAGLPLPRSIKDKASVILLRSSYYMPRTKASYQATIELMDKEGISCRVINSEGPSRLAQVLSAIYLGDYTSYYLALLYGVDPSPVDAISYLKGRLAQLR